jgi:nitrite reductase/ring-hydroxylating ferredoxin subunit
LSRHFLSRRDHSNTPMLSSPAIARVTATPVRVTRRGASASASRVGVTRRIDARVVVGDSGKRSILRAAPTTAALGSRRAVRGASIVPTAVVEPPASSTSTSTDSNPDDFDWHANWYPVAFEADLDDAAPYTFTLLGEPLVFWKDHTAAADTNPYRCTADKCPHRLVPLSEGRVNEKGEIECGYHGWTFKGDTGACTKIPQLPAEGTAMDTALASPRSCVTPYHTQVAQGILWVYPVSKMACGDDIDALPALPLIPELEHPDCVCQDIHRDLPMDYGTLLENVMDVSHVPFTHHNSVGKRENATPVVLEMVGDGLKPGGFEGIWREGEFILI